MSFSRAQILNHMNPMVDAAWAAYCDRECITDSTKVSKKGWYREQLMREFKVDTTAGMNKGKDFDLVMALFEEIAGAGFYWQHKVIEGDHIRARHKMEEVIKTLRLPDAYVAAICDQMGIPPARRSFLRAEQALAIRVALLKQVRRRSAAQGVFGGRVDEPGTPDWQDASTHQPQPKGMSAPPA
jgi:hypothetical protein